MELSDLSNENKKLTRHRLTLTPSMRLFAVGLVLQMFTTLVFAECSAPNLGEARKLLDADKAEQSAALLEQYLLEFAGNADCDYLFGLALYKAGQAGQALFAFERVLMVDPGNVDARLKAAQISVERDDAAYASKLLALLSDQQLNKVQQQEESQIRAKIAALGAGPVSIRGYILGGIGSDDNVTSGPDQNSLLIPSLGTTPTPLGTAARDHDLVGMLEAGMSLRKPISENAWLTGDGNIRQGFSRARKDVTESFVNLNLGVAKRKDQEFFGATLLAQDYLISKKTYRNALGMRLHWAHPLNAHAWLTSYFQQLNYDYALPTNNTTLSVIGVTHESRTADESRTLQCGIYAGRELAKDAVKPHLSFHILGAGLGGSMVLSKDLSISARVFFESQHHDAVDALYLYTRSDLSRSFGIAADYRLNERWHMLPRYSYTHNASNTALYDYSRNNFILQFKWEFDNAKI